MLIERDQALEAIRDLAQNFNECSDELKGDRSFILDAVKLVGGVLEFARSDFQNDEEIVFEAVKQNNKAMAFASDRLKSDQAFVKSLIDEGCYVLDNVSNELCEDESIVLAHVRRHCDSIKHAGFGLRTSNLEITKAAMHGSNLTNLEMLKRLFQNGYMIIDFEYKNKNISAKKAAADFIGLHNKVYKGRSKMELLFCLLITINRNGDCDAVTKEASAALDIDLTNIVDAKKLLVTGSSIIDFEYKNKNISVKKAVANIKHLHKKVFNGHYAASLLAYLSKTINRNGDCDVLIKEAFAALKIDITIENMYKLLPLEDFNLFNDIYNIYLRDLFKNHEVYPGNEEKITDYATDYLDDFPRCVHTKKMAFYKNSFGRDIGTPVSKKVHKKMLEINHLHEIRHPILDAFQKHKLIMTDVLDDQKLKCCNRALIYGFKMHTLDVLYAKDPKSPLIKTLLTNFNEEEKTKGKYKEWVKKIEGSSPISVPDVNIFNTSNIGGDERPSKYLRRDPALEAIGDIAQNFNKCNDELKSDRCFILDAVKLVGGELEFAISDFQNDKEIVFEAVKQNNKAMAFASDRLKSDQAFVKSLIDEGCYVLDNVSNELCEDESIVLAHVRRHCDSIKHAGFGLRTSNLEIIKAAMHGSNLTNPEMAKRLLVIGYCVIKLEYIYKKNISDKKAAAEFVSLHNRVFNGRNKIELLCYLSKDINRNGDCDVLIKEASAALKIDITIENMYKLLPLEDFNLFNDIYNIYLRDLFENHEVYPSDEEKITDYASDYLYRFPRCMHTNKIAFHKISFDFDIVGGFVSRKAHKEMLELNNHPLQKYKIAKSDIKVLDAQKLKCCNRALIYGFKMHTLDVLYAKDPKSPLIEILLTTFNEEEKTKSKYNEWVRSFGRTSPISVSMFGNESKEAESTDIDLNKGA